LNCASDRVTSACAAVSMIARAEGCLFGGKVRQTPPPRLRRPLGASEPCRQLRAIGPCEWLGSRRADQVLDQYG
jgi:hypothetical protein